MKTGSNPPQPPLDVIFCILVNSIEADPGTNTHFDFPREREKIDGSISPWTVKTRWQTRGSSPIRAAPAEHCKGPLYLSPPSVSLKKRHRWVQKTMLVVISVPSKTIVLISSSINFAISSLGA